jgi:hypothetical protein
LSINLNDLLNISQYFREATIINMFPSGAGEEAVLEETHAGRDLLWWGNNWQWWNNCGWSCWNGYNGNNYYQDYNNACSVASMTYFIYTRVK